MGNHGSDKGSHDITKSWHNYTIVYNELFKDRRVDTLRVFELGLGTNNTYIPSNMGKYGKPGASLRGWKEYFPNADIFGADIDRNILFTEERIKTYFCDQTEPRLIKMMWDEKDLELPFDIIIEDGLHTFEANVCFFENSVHKLAKNGIYVIEDIMRDDIFRFTAKLREWSSVYPTMSFTLMQIPSLVNSVDNTIVIIRNME
jgi:SAM-dependent methyltransferase